MGTHLFGSPCTLIQVESTFPQHWTLACQPWSTRYWWKKLNETSNVSSTTFGPINRCTAIWASLYISFQIKSCTMLRWLLGGRNLQLEEILTNEFSALLGEWSRLIDIACLIKDLKCWCFSGAWSNCNKDFKHWLFLFNQYFEGFVAVE